MVAARNRATTKQPTLDPSPARPPERVPERDLDAPYERIDVDAPARRHPTIVEIEAQIRRDPRTKPEVIAWLDHMDKVRRERSE